jgi:hypothetical protein
MNLVKNLILIVLFFLLSPNILFRLPGNKYVSALLHGAILSIIWYFSNPVLEGIKPSWKTNSPFKKEDYNTSCEWLIANSNRTDLTDKEKKNIKKRMTKKGCSTLV